MAPGMASMTSATFIFASGSAVSARSMTCRSVTSPAPDPHDLRAAPGAVPVLLLLVFLSLIGFGVVIPLLPFFASAFDAQAWQVTLLFSVYSAGQFLGELVWGRLSDRIGRRPVLLITITASAIGYVALAFAPGIWIAVAVRAAAGFFSGNMSVIQGYVVDVSPPEKLAGRLGLIGSAFGVGFVVGPALGGWLMAAGTSRPSVATIMALGSALAGLTVWLLKGEAVSGSRLAVRG